MHHGETTSDGGCSISDAPMTSCVFVHEITHFSALVQARFIVEYYVTVAVRDRDADHTAVETVADTIMGAVTT